VQSLAAMVNLSLTAAHNHPQAYYFLSMPWDVWPCWLLFLYTACGQRRPRLAGGGGSNLKEQCLTKPAVSQTYTDFQLFVLRRLSALYGFFYGLGASSALLSSLWESGVGERLSMGLSRGKPVVNRI
jgi:hypothetical protein